MPTLFPHLKATAQISLTHSDTFVLYFPENKKKETKSEILRYGCSYSAQSGTHWKNECFKRLQEKPLEKERGLKITQAGRGKECMCVCVCLLEERNH